tara:strand:- start:2191 stop:3204 length:1014 start_codon:yes stop_codon:yes gene_type:complete
MKILFIGPKLGNSYIQFLNLKKIYKNVDIIDSNKAFFLPYITKRIFYHISPKILELNFNSYILSKIKKDYDLIYVKSGEIIGKKLILELKKKTKKIVYFCNDNPFVKRDKQRWKLFLHAAKFYDLIAYQDISRIKLSKKLGLKNSLLVLPPYELNIHKKQKLTPREKNKFKNDVIFIGTWSYQKGAFIKKLIEFGLNIKIYGGLWDKDPNYNLIKSRIVLGHVFNPNYSKLIQNAKIALCLFAEGNLDTITARSIEIPAIGTLLVSLRTKSMKKVFIENKEAIFFKTPKECFKKCQYYLNNNMKANKISKNGNIKITKVLKPSNDQLIRKIVNSVFC